MNQTPWEAIVVAAVSVSVVAGAWLWRQEMAHELRPSLLPEAWEQVRTQFPLPSSLQDPANAADNQLQAIVRANPFSPQRRSATQGESTGDGGAASVRPAASASPQFVYKGRVVLGANARAVVEDLTAKKTYFLQVGQEVAGCKVLDISETQVVLSVPRSEEPLVLKLMPKSEGG